LVRATLTDVVGGTATSADPGFSLTGGLRRNGLRGAPDRLCGRGGVATSLFRAGGSRHVDVRTSGQTLTSDAFDTFDNHGVPDSTFVFEPGHGLDVVGQFRAGGALIPVVPHPNGE